MNPKTKRILAIIGIVLLVSLYVLTFIFSLIDSTVSMSLFKVSFYSTIVVPVLLYAYVLVYKYLKDNNK